jgi:acyl carrier protein
MPLDPMAGEQLARFIESEVSKDKQQLVHRSSPLFSSGLVDSFSLIRILIFIEDQFGIVVPDEAATAEAMDSVERILELMRKFGGARDNA